MSQKSSEEEVEYLRSKVRDLETVLGQTQANTIAVAFKLTPTSAKILGLLMAVHNVLPEHIHKRLEIATDPKVAMHRLRKDLKSFGITVKSKRTLGYWLEADMKDKVREMLAEVEKSDAYAVPADKAAA